MTQGWPDYFLVSIQTWIRVLHLDRFSNLDISQKLIGSFKLTRGSIITRSSWLCRLRVSHQVAPPICGLFFFFPSNNLEIWQLLMKFSSEGWDDLTNDQLNFDGDPDHRRDSKSFKMLFHYLLFPFILLLSPFFCLYVFNVFFYHLHHISKETEDNSSVNAKKKKNVIIIKTQTLHCEQNLHVGGDWLALSGCFLVTHWEVRHRTLRADRLQKQEVSLNYTKLSPSKQKCSQQKAGWEKSKRNKFKKNTKQDGGIQVRNTSSEHTTWELTWRLKQGKDTA